VSALLAVASEGPSVVDAHVAAAALAMLRGPAGAAVFVTSDSGDVGALLAAGPDSEIRARHDSHALATRRFGPDRMPRHGCDQASCSG
jgi:hypothetical protein